MLNYTSRPDDVLTMAHELGHGVHAALARPQGIFQFTTPLTLAETASIFGETIVLERLLERAPDAAARLDLLAGALDGAVAAVFRQIAMNRFEDSVHRERRERGELATDRFGELWLESQSELLGDSVDLSDDYGLWWSYVRHFVDTPGYVYAYPYGHLLALSVYRRYEEAGAGLRAVLPRPAASGRLAAPGGAGRHRGRGPLRSRLLGLRPRPDRAPARGRGGAPRAGGTARRRRVTDRLVEERVALPGGEVELARPRDPEALLSEEAFEHEEFLPYWAELWSSGVALAHDVARRSLRGARTLELGCGLALPSIAAARAGGRVLATDWSADAVAAAAGNARRNGAAVETMVCDWAAPAPLLARAPFQLVLASDVLYEQRNVDQLLDLLPRLVGERGRILLADPGRAPAERFLARARDTSR